MIRCTLTPAEREAAIIDVLKRGTMQPRQIHEFLPDFSLTTIRKTLGSLRMAGLVVRTGYSCFIAYELSDKAATPDECHERPFEHRRVPVGKWQYRPPARAVASVWQLGAGA